MCTEPCVCVCVPLRRGHVYRMSCVAPAASLVVSVDRWKRARARSDRSQFCGICKSSPPPPVSADQRQRRRRWQRQHATLPRDSRACVCWSKKACPISECGEQLDMCRRTTSICNNILCRTHTSQTVVCVIRCTKRRAQMERVLGDVTAARDAISWIQKLTWQ